MAWPACDGLGCRLRRFAWVATWVLLFVEVFGKYDKAEEPVTREVGSSLELQQAFLDPEVARIWVTRDLQLRRDVWPGHDERWKFALVLGRNVTLEPKPSLKRRPVVDVDFMRFRVGTAPHRKLVVRGLNFTSAVKNEKDTTLQLTVPFFALLPSSTVILEDIVTTVAVDFASPLGRLLSVAGTVRPLGFQDKENRIDIVGNEDCLRLGGVECPDKAIWVADFANIIKISGHQGAEWLAIFAVRDSFMVAVNMSSQALTSTEDISKQRSIAVETMLELYNAIKDPEVVAVHLYRDLAFDMSAWPNAEGCLVLSVELDRDLLIATHPINSSFATIDFNLAEQGIQLVGGATLTLRRLFLTRTSRDPNSTLSLPFFNITAGSKLELEDVVAHTPVPSTDPDFIRPFMVQVEAYGGVPGDMLLSVEYHNRSQCRSFVTNIVQKKVKCDGGFLVTSLLHESPVVGLLAGGGKHADMSRGGEGLVVAENTFFAALNVNRRRIKRAEEELLEEEGTVLVGSEVDLRRALKNATINVILLRTSLNLTENAWPDAWPLVVDRDLTVKSHPSLGYNLAIDLDFMIGRVEVANNYKLEFERVNLTRVSRDGSFLHYVPFFWWQNNSTLSFKHVLSQMAVEPHR